MSLVALASWVSYATWQMRSAEAKVLCFAAAVLFLVAAFAWYKAQRA